MFRLERDNERPTRAEICIVRLAEGPCPGTERPQHPYGSRHDGWSAVQVARVLQRC